MNIKNTSGETSWEISGYFNPKEYNAFLANKETPVNRNIAGQSLLPKVSRVLFNNPATIVWWSDGTKTVTICQEGDVFDEEKGLAIAIAKKALGNNYIASGRLKKAYKQAERSKKNDY